MADRTQQWVELRAPINGKPVSSTPAAVDDTSVQPPQAASTAARAIGTTEQEAFSAELVDVPLPPSSEDGEDMDLSSSRKRCRDSDSSDDEAAAPRKLVVAVPSVQEDTTVDSTTTLHSETTYTSQDSPTTTGAASASPESHSGADGSTSPTSVPAVPPPAAVTALADTQVMEVPAEEKDEDTISLPPSAAFLKTTAPPTTPDPVPRPAGRSYASVVQGTTMPAAHGRKEPAAQTSSQQHPAVAPAAQRPAAPVQAQPPASLAGSAAPSLVVAAKTPGATGPAATTEAQQAVDRMAQLLLQAIQLASSILPAGQPLSAICLQAMALQTTTTKHG
ncbi:hypothetical protein MTO96_032727 [Rhipicephalus appendiculatus]